jgi:hypothetical protein
MKVKAAPIGADSIATTSASLIRQTSAMKALTPITP